jgi:hypothetical protein
MAAMATAFAGFADDNRPSHEALETHLAEMRALTGFAKYELDPQPYRRFAGDSTLPRSRYYTVASTASGDDEGTLVRELRAYYNARNAGIIQVFDTTSTRDKQALARLPDRGPSLVVVFLPLAGRPNRFASVYTEAATPLLVYMPLRLETRRVEDVVDLREPETARIFTETLTRLQWDVRDARLPCFPLKAPLRSFAQLLPSLLEQCLGGSGVTNIVGIWLRKVGAKGLVFPSARVDPSVEVNDGQLVSAGGWNFVDYAGAPTAAVTATVDLGEAWPTAILHTPEGPQADWIYTIPSARVVFEASGRHAGSWRVQGLRNAREASWRFMKAWVCVDAFATAVEKDQFRPIYEWLFGMFARVFPRYRVAEMPSSADNAEAAARDLENLGATSAALEEALLGDTRRKAQVSDFAATLGKSNSELAKALDLLLAQSAGAAD